MFIIILFILASILGLRYWTWNVILQNGEGKLKGFISNHLWGKAQPLDITPLNPNPLFDMQ
jgi:hypothetical protein